MSASPAANGTLLSAHPLHDGVGEQLFFRSEIAPIDNVVEPDDRLIMAHDPCDPRCERIRALRTELLLRSEGTDRADIIALVSPCAGEGRSLLAADLAIAFAQTGRPTLLVDADLRRPRQQMLFGTDNRHGLAQAIESGEPPHLRSVFGMPRDVAAYRRRDAKRSAGTAVEPAVSPRSSRTGARTSSSS